MAKRLKLRISRILQSCRSKDLSSLPSNPDPSFHKSIHAPPQRTEPRRSSLGRHVASVLTCGYLSYGGDDPPPKFEWEQEDEFWHVVVADSPRRKIYNSSASDRDVAVSELPPVQKKKKKRRAQKKKTTGRAGSMSTTSSADSGALFSDDAVLVSSSRSFSTDSEFSARLKPIREGPPRRRRRRAAPARLSAVRRVEGKVRDSFAVVKRSEDPYEDFKRSMTEMIVEKQMEDDEDLEQLLHCFLSLNSRNHHGVIIQAFAEIWDAMFSYTTRRRRSSST